MANYVQTWAMYGQKWAKGKTTYTNFQVIRNNTTWLPGQQISNIPIQYP